ncbi:FAD dependent oxidoreductase [Phytophthora infestans]|uniref:FAD dependent oxidoreductase n=1 Tax=Phytophthora infestans TaxID=4787 RepID=A0A833WGK5_PHYIN|nr:FAD dependent oxidoreductase [Phytophthora infestans]KAF4146093.1 FAD dependent oxidoreductase [Phytophthora infestans]
MKSAAECRVLVVGGGVIGLTSALALLQSGFRHVRVVAESFEATTSHIAGGLWMPFSLPDDADPAKPRKWCEASYAWLTQLMETHGEEAGIHVVQGVEVSSEGPPLVVHPYWAHCVENFRLLSREEAVEVSADAEHGFAFGTIIYNTGVFMKWLQKEVRQLGATFEQRRVNDFNVEDCDLLVNCSGLAARDLAGDDTVYPIRGQIIKVHNPRLDKYVAVIHRDGHHTYIIPRPHGDVVLGGTVQPHCWNVANDDADVKGVWERCCKLWPEVRNSTRIEPVAGLRPGRSGGVCLEMDPRPTNGGALVIHNYAHGGSGHTLHWGCALDVVALASKHFRTHKIGKL